MTMAPVGIRCPEHSGQPQGVQRVAGGVRRASYEGAGAKVTRILIGLNLAVYIAELLTGGGVNGTGSWIYEKGVLVAGHVIDSNGNIIGVAEGDWWRLITAAFLHYGPLHLLLNMLGLYWFGTLLEERIGSGRFLLLYIVSGLAGSAGALVLDPTTPTVGASGAIFGILGAGFVLERQRDYVFGGSALGIIVINLVFTLTFPSISIGGHIGGLIGGALAMLGMTRFGRANAAYGNPGLAGTLAVVMVGVVSVLISYFKVRGYAT
jgi:membrane associated rhomboid family serine protease